jgi:hypothetical protein
MNQSQYDAAKRASDNLKCSDCKQDWPDVGMCCIYRVPLCQTCFRAREEKIKAKTF